MFLGKLHRLKYFLSHVPFHLRRLQRLHYSDLVSTIRRLLNMRANLSVRYFRYISNVILMVALCVGLYARWMFSKDTVILVIAFFALFIFAISSALVYYFSMERIGFTLSRLWIGCLLGVVAFTDRALVNYDTSEEVMNILLMTSVGVRCFWNVLERCMHLVTSEPSLVASMDMFEMLGMCIASLMCGVEFVAVSLMITSLAITISAIRLKSFLAVINLLAICLIAGLQFFPKILQMSVNPFALCCFVGRLSFEPIIDLYFSGFTMLERWRSIFIKSSLVRRQGILLLILLELTFFIVSAVEIPRHKEWFIVVPIFAAFSLVWWSYHIVFFITIWQLSNKITICNNTSRSLLEESHNMNCIMASKGVRHFSLIAQRLTLVTFISTIVLTLIGWITKSALSLSLLLMVVPLEGVIMSLFWELSRVLGGTCTGYAVVAPVTPHRPDQVTTVLPTTAMQEMSARATHILNTVQRFFTHHLVDTYGCDYSSSGLTAESVQSKLRNFFQRVTTDGPRFDTYLVYYSGHVFDNGDWALADNENLKLDTILEWWREYNSMTDARLILVLDTTRSFSWLRDVRHTRDAYIAVQTCRMRKVTDPEEGEKVKVGDFTTDWVLYNSSLNGAEVDWKDKERLVRAAYTVSRSWTDFAFHMPTKQDMESHWDSNFPKVTKPLIKITNFPQCGQLFCCCDGLLRCLRRKRMTWLPPSELDTGHGFKLVSS